MDSPFLSGGETIPGLSCPLTHYITYDSRCQGQRLPEIMFIDRQFHLSYNISVDGHATIDHARDRRLGMGSLTAREAGELLGLEHLEVIRRIRRGQIFAAKKGGWFWLIPEKEIEQVKRKPWYRHLMALRAKRNS